MYKRSRRTRLAAGLLALAVAMPPAYGMFPQEAAGGTVSLPETPAQNGSIAFVSDRDGDREIYTMSPDGSAQAALTANESISDSNPSFSADGKRIAYERDSAIFEENNLWHMAADGADKRQVPLGELTSNPAFSPDGNELAVIAQTCVYCASGPGVSIGHRTLDGSRSAYEFWREDTVAKPLHTSPAWSPDGSVAFRRMADSAGADDGIYMMDGRGGAARKLTEGGSPAFSPDAKKLAFTNDVNGNADVYVMNIDGTGLERLTEDEAIDSAPAFSPDGEKIAFTTNRDGNFEVYTMNADGSEETNVTRNPANDFSPAWGKAADVQENPANPEPDSAVKPPPPNTPPRIGRLSPAPGSATTDRTPTISATVRDAQTDLIKSDMSLYVDGNYMKRFSYNASTDRLVHAPQKELFYGKHQVRIRATDTAGGTTYREYSFSIRR